MHNPCGSCAYCCKFLEIEDKNLKKEAHEWCPLWKKGVGCIEYENRPETCRGFNCMWLESQKFAEEGRWPVDWRPDKCRAVFTCLYDKVTLKEGGGLAGEKRTGLLVSVDPNYPDLWMKKDKGRLLDTVKRLCAANNWTLEW